MFPNPVERAGWLLRATIILYSLGVAAALFSRSGSAIGDIALMDFGIGHGTIFFWERAIAIFLLVAALSLLAYPTVVAAAAIAALAFLEAYAAYRSGGFPFAEYTPLTSALRYLTPLALIPLILTQSIQVPGRWRAIASASILRAGLAIVFLSHGFEALWLHPEFVDYIIGSFRNIFNIAVTESTAAATLKIIALVDLVVALLILIRPWRPLLAWLCFWGLLTALSRPLAHGLGAYPEVLVRAAHVLAPIAIWWILAGLRSPDTRTKSGSTEPAPEA